MMLRRKKMARTAAPTLAAAFPAPASPALAFLAAASPAAAYDLGAGRRRE